jgi:hypothetical protein
MWRICWPWHDWIAVIALLRMSTAEDNRQHADLIQSRLDAIPADVVEPCLAVPDDVVLRSVNLARWTLGLTLPEQGRARIATARAIIAPLGPGCRAV